MLAPPPSGYNRGKLGILGAIFVLGLYFSSIPIKTTSFETSFNSLGILLRRDGDEKNAEIMYNKALEIAPRYPTPHYNLALIYRDRGDRRKAINHLRQAVKIDPNFTVAKNELRRLGGA